MKLLLLSLIFTLISCSGGRNSTGYSLINDMMYSETYESFSDNPVFDDGQTMQSAPIGTIARGKMPHPMTADGQPEVLENPYTMTEYTWQRGERLFNSTCTACHGMDGKGKGSVVKLGYFSVIPNFKARRFKYSKKERYPSGQIFNTITFGRGTMPSHAQQLYAEDRWYVSEYVREKLMTKGKN
jgi:mono/diheme cytochrome c family protein